MCDLIDLNSPDVRGALESKLASPLIPAPDNVNDTTSLELATGKREGEGNNPFDQVLHETVEYVSKKDDPFEMMLQQALNSKDQKIVQPPSFMDDFTPRRRKKYLKTMNKTCNVLDELSLESRFGLFDIRKKEVKPKTENVEQRNCNNCDKPVVVKQEHKTTGPESLELSILNQSAMNDTLLDGFPKSKEIDKFSSFIEKDPLLENLIFPSNIGYYKLSNIHRSLSQSAEKPPIELPCSNKRSYSMTDGQRKVSQSTDSSSIPSILDKGFLESKLSEHSAFSNLSNISSITRLTSASLSSLVMSNDALNYAFLEDGSLKTNKEKEKTSANENFIEVKSKQCDLSDLTERLNKLKCAVNDSSSIPSILDKGFLESKLSEHSAFSNLSNISSITRLTSASLSSLVMSNDALNYAFLEDGSLKTNKEKEKTSANENFIEVKSKQCDLSNLTERLNKLKCAVNDTIDISTIVKDDSDSIKEENSKQVTNKLLDVDVFMPEKNNEFNKSLSSTCSSDSVFINTNKINKSILNEANVLAKTFEELASKTDSGSGVDDDLISNNTLWMSELLPAFDDEPVVNDLIDLPISPEGNSRNIRNNDTKQSLASNTSAEENLLKKLETPLNGVSAIKQDISSLLADLRKLIKAENNPEAKKLLDNLENTLDINYKNNTELLITYLNISNKSSSSQKTSSDDIERLDKSNIESKEERSKMSSQEKLRNKQSPDINHISEDMSQNVQHYTEKSSVISSFSKDDNENYGITNLSNLTENNKHKEENNEKDNQMDKMIAVELLENLKKILTGQAEDDTTIQLLKNIGKALNIALTNNNVEHEMQSDDTRQQNVHKITSELSESNSNAHPSAFSIKVAHKQNLKSKSKMIRRSVSATEPSSKSMSCTQTQRRRHTSELENRQKRFSSDSGLANDLTNKKLTMPETYNITRVDVGIDNKKKKSINVNDVRNKLKKKSDVVSKRGPLKAVHPVDNMQKKRTSVGRQTSSNATTPPKSYKTTPLGNKVISSTPNSTDNNYMSQKSVRSKPIASSTPDGQNSKNAPLVTANKKRNLSYDISPVTTYVNSSGSDGRKDSPKRTSKLPTPKKCTTPTRQSLDSFGIPKFLTPPRHYSTLNTNKSQSPQRLNKSLINFQRYSPLNEKNAKKIQQSPLKDSNRITKVKPLNLIYKIKRHSNSEKENDYP